MDDLDQIQAEKGLQDMAHLTWVFYAALRDEGFGRREAMSITMTWMVHTINGGSE